MLLPCTCDRDAFFIFIFILKSMEASVGTVNAQWSFYGCLRETEEGQQSINIGVQSTLQRAHAEAEQNMSAALELACSFRSN